MLIRVGRFIGFIFIALLLAPIFNVNFANSAAPYDNDAKGNYYNKAEIGGSLPKLTESSSKPHIEVFNKKFYIKKGGGYSTRAYPSILTFEADDGRSITLDVCKPAIMVFAFNDSSEARLLDYRDLESEDKNELVTESRKLYRQIKASPSSFPEPASEYVNFLGTNASNKCKPGHLDLTPLKHRKLKVTFDFNLSDDQKEEFNEVEYNADRSRLFSTERPKGLRAYLYDKNLNRIVPDVNGNPAYCYIADKFKETGVENKADEKVTCEWSSPYIVANEYGVRFVGIEGFRFGEDGSTLDGGDTACCGDGAGRSKKGYIPFEDGDYNIDTLALMKAIKHEGDPGVDEGESFDEENEEVAAAVEAGTASLTGDAIGDGDGEDAPSCASSEGGIGWIICPVANWMIAKLTDFKNVTLNNLLEVNVEPFRNGSNPLRETFNNVLTIANVLFVLVFIFIIIAQTTFTNIDAYTIKKILPRLVIGVIATQLSFFLVGILVDISNVLGKGVGSLVSSVGGGGSGAFSGSIEFLGGSTIEDLGAGLAVGGFLIWLLITTLPAILIIALAIMLTLIFRQAIISILIVVAPLAFVSWILPNTEKYFKMWVNTLAKVLLMFPLIMLLISAGQLTGSLLTSGDVLSHDAADSDVAKSLQAFGSLILTFAPYALIPYTFKFAGGAMGAIAGKINAAGAKGGVGVTKKIASKQNEYRKKTAAGATRLGSMRRGGGVLRAAAAPTSIFSRRKRRSQAVAGTALAMKEMEENNIDGETAMAIGMSDDEFRGYVTELADHGLEDVANRLTDARNDPANRKWRDTNAGQQAALLRAAQQGHINESMLASVDQHQGWSPADRTNMTSKLTRAAHQQGRPDVASRGNTQSYVARLSSKEVKGTHRDSVPAVTDAIYNNLEGNNLQHYNAQQRAEAQEHAVGQLGDLLHGRSEIDPTLRRQLEQRLEHFENGNQQQRDLARRVREQVEQVQAGNLP